MGIGWTEEDVWQPGTISKAKLVLLSRYTCTCCGVGTFQKNSNVKFLKHINIPILLGSTGNMPPARAVHFIYWGTTDFIFNYIIFNRHKKWWSRHNYILSGVLDVGLAFCAILCYFTLQMEGIPNLGWWGGSSGEDHCPLASCPTAPGIKVSGCPFFH